ncbi:hypothetical protein COO60DRAFT_99985 [Scenedesmus sp. NREL 46B-D3]|nr:hypothetical protein COO60DRAFT_99985 [Scenedesmus sp. NREL 46B-D3]
MGWRYHTQRAQVARNVLRHFHMQRLRLAFDTWRSWQQRKAWLGAVFSELQGRGHKQILQVVWSAWRAFVPSSRTKRHVRGRALLFWQHRLRAVCFFSWQDYVTARARTQQQLVTVLLHWERRLAGGAFRAWRQAAQLQVYRRHVVQVMGSRMSSGLLFKTFSCWRDLVLAKQARRQQAAAARGRWASLQRRRVLLHWRLAAHDEHVTRKVMQHWQQGLLARVFARWRQAVLLHQEVVNLRHQVSGRLRGFAARMAHADLARAWDGWRERVLLRQMAVMAAARWRAGMVAGCFRSWRLWTVQRRTAAHKVHHVRSRVEQRLASAVLREWAALAWELPRARKAAALQELWLQRRVLWGWRDWLRLRVRWCQFDVAVATRWTNLHLSAAWHAWRGWQLQRQQKREAARTVARRWTNLHLAAAFQAWWEMVQVHRHRKAVCETVAGRWRNLHTAAAFGAWRSFVRRQATRRSAHTAVAARWTNLHLTMAFGAWREAVSGAAARAAAAAASAQRLERQLLAAALLGWQQVTMRKAAVRVKGSALQQRWRRQQLRRGLDSWLVAVAWQAAKRRADVHWHYVVLRSLLRLWWSHTERKASHARTVLLLLSRSELQLLRRSFASWRGYSTYRQQKAVAGEHAASARLQQVFTAWSSLASESRQRADAANAMSARLQARSRGQLLQASITSWRQYSAYHKQKAAADEYARAKLQQQVFWGWLVLAEDARQRHSAAASMAAGVAARAAHEMRLACFAGWQMLAVRTRTVKATVLAFSARRMRCCLQAWLIHARQLAGASRMLRQLLASTLAGAFLEWRAVAGEKAHWRRVGLQLEQFTHTSDGSSTAQLARQAAVRWRHWPLSVAFEFWRANAAEETLERTNEKRASTFLYFALTAKALTGFKWAVRDAHVNNAAGQHRRVMTQRSVLRAWRVAALHVKEKRQKLVAALFTYASGLTRRATVAWLLCLQRRHAKAQQWQRAARHYVLRRKAACLSSWLRTTRYLAPLRRNMGQLHTKRQQQTMRQVVGAWQLHVYRAELLRHALARVLHKALAEAFGVWRELALQLMRRRLLLQAAIARISHLQLSRAFNRWREAAAQLQQLRAKAQLVLARTLQRQLLTAYGCWRAYVAHRSWKCERLALALAHWHATHRRRTLAAWKTFIEEARHYQRLSQRMLAARQRARLAASLHWWHLAAQDLHHHRAVLASFRARRMRRDGHAVLRAWRCWARERAQERRAMVCYWNRLLVTAFGGWMLALEEARTARAEALHAVHLTARGLAAWKLAMALAHRKRVLCKAAQQLCGAWSVRKGLQRWMVFAYYRHMGHVALHFRIRRLGCIVMRAWQQAARERAQLRHASLELTHQLAVSTAASLLTHWQQLAAARRHQRRRLLRGCWGELVCWTARHRVRSRMLRAAVQQLDMKKRERCFYTWRWYCQVRVLRNVAFQHKQRAIREALAIGEQVARRRRAALLASTFMAWHVQVSMYRKVAEKLASLLHHSLATCFRAWRDAAGHARVDMLLAERHAGTTTLRRLLPAWLMRRAS